MCVFFFDEGREDPINITSKAGHHCAASDMPVKLRFTGGSIRLLAGWLCDFQEDSEQYC